MNENFAYLIEKYGNPQRAESFPAEMAERWKGRLPPGLIEFWSECGIGQWQQGKLQFCEPARYAPITQAIFAGDPEFKPAATHLVAFSAFGKLIFWNEEWQCLNVNLPYLWADADRAAPDWTPDPPDNAIAAFLMGLSDKRTFDFSEDAPGTPLMFDRARNQYGTLEPGQCYGFFPALALGGTSKLGNIRRVRALEHFGTLAQLGPVRLVDFSGGRMRTVRNIGPA